MNNSKKQMSLRGLLLICLFSILQAFSPVMAQCPVLVGGSDFYDKAHSDTIWAGDLNLIETLGPTGAKFSSALTYADSAQAFLYDSLNVYAVTTNPHLLDTTYIDVDQYMLVAHVAADKNATVSANTKLISFRVSGIEKGSDFEITFDLTCLNGTEYGIGATDPTSYLWSLEAGVDLDQYGSSSSKVKESIKLLPGTTVPVTLKGTLPANLDYIQLDVITGYNFMPGMSVGMTNLRVNGCYKPHVKSSQGIEVCRGEQVLISLDKEYNATSYEWFKSTDDGNTFTSVGSGKNIYEEIKEEKASFFCVVNGVNSDTINIKTIVCCVDAEGNAMSRMDVFYDDFGYFDDLRSYTDAFGNSTVFPATYAPERADVTFDLSATGMTFDESGQINDGTYGVVVPTATGYYQDISGNSRATWMAGVSSDHSGTITGKSGGGALFMNVTRNYTGVIFSRKIDGLCTDKNIFFETYIANMSGGTDPEVTINIKDASDGTVLATAKETAVKDAGWIRVHIDELQVSASSIILEIESTGGKGDNSGQFWEKGNDLIIDDIRFMVCSPPSVDIYSDIQSFASDTTICADTDFDMGTPTSDLLKSFFKNDQHFLYQHSADGKAWENMGSITTSETKSFNTSEFPADTNYFRVVVAREDALKPFLTNPDGADYDDKCRNYSISKAFKIIRAGSIDMGKDMEVSECGGLTVDLNGSNDGTLVRWSWEDADGNILVPTTADVDAKVYSYKVTDDAVLTFTGYNKDGCMGKRKFAITKKSTVEFTLDSTMECEKTVVDAVDAPTGTTYTWFYGGDELSETGASVEFDPTAGPKTLKVVGNATGLCESDTVSLDVAILSTPADPVPLATEAQEQVKKGATFDFSTMVPELKGLQWADSENGPWAVAAPEQSLDVAGTFVNFVRVVSDSGCPSNAVELTLVVNSAPMPGVRNDTVCVGTDVDFTQYITKSNEADGFELAWYESETATTSETTPATKTATVGTSTLEYWVSQKNALAESDKAHIVVTVAEAAKPVVADDEIVYCFNSTAVELTATATADEANNIFSTGLEWRVNNNVTTDLIPATDVAGTTVYSVYGLFEHPNTLNGDAVCYSEPTTVTVTVVQVDAPVVSQVNYLKTDAVGGLFKNLLEQSQNKAAVASDGCTLKWYDETKKALPRVPTPDSDPDLVGDKELVYYVSQVDANGCESELVPVNVTISSSPMPVTESLSYCEGATATALTAQITLVGNGDAESDYSLVWYTVNPNEDPSAIGSASAPVPSTDITNGETTQDYTYYVAQVRSVAGKDVVSRATPLTVTVYARPVLTTVNPDPVCEPATIDLSSSNYWAVKAAKLTVNAYFDQTKTSEYPTPNAVDKSGEYWVQASFLVNNEECVSEPKAINVQIDYIRGLSIDGDERACPDNEAKLKAVTSEFSPSSISYVWSSKQANDERTVTTENFSTVALPGPASTKYIYNLTATAGACTVNAEADHTITIGDGPISGTLAITEDGNTDSDVFTLDDKNNTVLFKSCGGPVSVAATMTASLNDFVWTKAGSSVASSSTLSLAAGDEGDYVLSYTNGCPTSINVKVVSVPLAAVAGQTSALQICEGDDFSTSVIVSCPENTYHIQWYQDGNELTEFADKKDVAFTPATAANNGVYSYKVTNNGCSVEGEIADGKPVKVRPYIEFEYQSDYVARRDSMLEIPLKINVPQGKVPSDIIWRENGIVFDKGESISLKVNADHVFNVELSDDDYCSASGQIAVHKDARLKMSVTLDEVMCAADSRDLIIDTTGTGTFYHNGYQGFTIIEQAEGAEERVYTGGWRLDTDGKLHFTVSPSASATYTVRFFYLEGRGVEEQNLVIRKSIQLLEPVNMIPPYGLAVCADGETELEIALTSVTPAGVLVSWTDDPSITSGLESSSIVVTPEFDASVEDNFYTKTYYASGSYSICSEVKIPVNITVYKPLTGSIVAPEGICEGMSAKIDASSYNAGTYAWTYAQGIPSSDTFAVSSVIDVTPSTSTAYAVEMTRGECAASDEFELAVSSKPKVVSVDSVYYNERIVVVSEGTPDYTFWLDNNKDSLYTDSHITNITYGKHIVHVVDKNQCETDTTFIVSAPDIKIPTILTPNEDGFNDHFTTPIINDAFPTANIKIFDRWGKKLVEYKGSEQGWDGTYNGSPMPSTDYWYEIEVKELNKTYTGHFTLMRQ